jgi:ketosteroid isomerase-like protein
VTHGFSNNHPRRYRMPGGPQGSNAMNTSPRVGLLAAALLLPVLAACQKPALPADASKEIAVINARINALNRASTAKDPEGAVAADAPDIRAYGGGGPDIGSKDEDLKIMKAIMADPAYAYQLRPEHTEIAKSGDIAFQTGSWTASATNPGTKSVAHWAGHWVAGWRKDAAGAWKMAALSVANPPSPSTAASNAIRQ